MWKLQKEQVWRKIRHLVLMLLFECGRDLSVFISGSCFPLRWLNFQECPSQLVAMCSHQLRTYITNLANPVIIVAEDLGKAPQGLV